MWVTVHSRSVACRIGRAGERPITPRSGEIPLLLVFAMARVGCAYSATARFELYRFASSTNLCMVF